MNRRRVLGLLLSGLLVAVCFGPATVANANERAELRERFEERYPQLQRLKLDGQVGETHQGMVEAAPDVTLPTAASRVVEAENTDRRRLYQLLAEETGATPDIVAQRNARRNFERAQTGEWLKHPDGWRRK